jgi:hypothetical protein
VTFFDTAEMYSVPPKAETLGLDRADHRQLAQGARQSRRHHPRLEGRGRGANTWLRDDKRADARHPRKQIREAVEKSLSGSAPTISTSTSSTGRSGRLPFGANPDPVRRKPPSSARADETPIAEQLDALRGDREGRQGPASSASPTRAPGAL